MSWANNRTMGGLYPSFLPTAVKFLQIIVLYAIYPWLKHASPLTSISLKLASSLTSINLNPNNCPVFCSSKPHTCSTFTMVARLSVFIWTQFFGSNLILLSIAIKFSLLVVSYSLYFLSSWYAVGMTAVLNLIPLEHLQLNMLLLQVHSILVLSFPSLEWFSNLLILITSSLSLWKEVPIKYIVMHFILDVCTRHCKICCIIL